MTAIQLRISRRLHLPLLSSALVLFALACGEPLEETAVDAGSTADEYGAAWAPGEVGSAKTTRLCTGIDDPAGLKDKVFIDCQLEGELNATPLPTTPTGLVVHSWNVERGYHVDKQIKWLQDRTQSPLPDVLLLSEADRGCARTGFRNVTADIARALKMDYAYAVEFVELGAGDKGTKGHCEHGNALLSRWPMRDVVQLRHASQDSWWPERLGGRVAVAATIVTKSGPIRFWSLHLESQLSQVKRAAQAAEVADIAVKQAMPTIAGGDLNAGLYFADLLYDRVGKPEAIDEVLKAFMAQGFADAHLGIPREERGTHKSGNVLDFILARKLKTSGARICPKNVCDSQSDHQPIWAVARP